VLGSLVGDVALMVSEWSMCLVHWSVMLLSWSVSGQCVWFTGQ